VGHAGRVRVQLELDRAAAVLIRLTSVWHGTGGRRVLTRREVSSWSWRPGPLTKALRRRHVPFVVIGSTASACYIPLPRPPADLDVLVLGGSKAADRAMATVGDLIRRYRDVRVPPFSATGFDEGIPLVIETPVGSLHVVSNLAGDLRDHVVRRRHWVLIDRTLTPIARLDDLIMLKERVRGVKDWDLDPLRKALKGGSHE